MSAAAASMLSGSAAGSAGGAAASSAGAGAGAQLASSGVAVGGNIASNVVSYFLNKKLSDRRNEQAIEQWKRENEYNLPVNQMARLRAAGLNPNLMYENGASGLISASSPDMSMSQISPMEFDPRLFSDVSESITRQGVNKREQERLRNEADNLKKQGDILGYESLVKAGTYLGEIAALNAGNKLTESEATEKVKYVTQTVKDMADMVHEQLEKARNENRISQANYNKVQKELSLLEKQLKKADSEVREAESRANQQEYLESMQEVTYWTQFALHCAEFASDAVGIFNVLRNVFKIKVPIGRSSRTWKDSDGSFHSESFDIFSK